jgi:hypothetical protein
MDTEAQYLFDTLMDAELSDALDDMRNEDRCYSCGCLISACECDYLWQQEIQDEYSGG